MNTILVRGLTTLALLVALPVQAHLRDVMQTQGEQEQMVVVEQELEGLRPEMLDWWWNKLGRDDFFCIEPGLTNG